LALALKMRPGRFQSLDFEDFEKEFAGIGRAAGLQSRSWSLVFY
jgi:hypothetical protein